MKNKEELAELYTLRTDGDAWEIDAFIAGFEAGELANPQNVFHFNLGRAFQKKKIIDKINSLKSKLKQETQFKLTKTYNTQQIEKLKNQIEVLEQLIIKTPKD